MIPAPRNRPVIRVSRDTHEAPAETRWRLARANRLSRRGEPNFRVVWGGSEATAEISGDARRRPAGVFHCFHRYAQVFLRGVVDGSSRKFYCAPQIEPEAKRQRFSPAIANV